MITKNYFFPVYSKWIFVVLFLSLSVLYNYQNILFSAPQSVHQWRQCDCLSITMNYFQNNNSFFEPSIHNLGADGTGKTVSDFPLLYYSIAELWKIFGYHEFIYRSIVLLFFFTGLFALFKIFETTLKDSILAIVCSLLLFTSPTLVYYANNFLMDIPAFSLAIIGLYFFFRFKQTLSDNHFYLFILFYTIAGLLKISSLLSFISIIIVFLFELFTSKVNSENPKQYKIKYIFLFIGALFAQVIWYMYASNYNSKYNSGFFLIGILPVWAMSMPEIKTTFYSINEHIKWDYFRKETQIVFGLMFLFVIVFYKRANKLILFLITLTAIGCLVYFLLFFQALGQHDYYTINLFILAPLLVLGFLLLLKERFYKIYNSVFFRIILIAFLIHNVDFARRRMEDRYSAEGWQNKDYIENMQSLREISPYLKSIGIKKDDKILCLSDNSINVSLYLMNMKGWTNYETLNDSLRIRKTITQGAKYLFIYNKETYKISRVQSFIKNKVGTFKNVDIYAF